jgi:hypothetical protein
MVCGQTLFTSSGYLREKYPANCGTFTDTFAAGSHDQDLERLDRLESLFESIRSAPLSVVDHIVREVRCAHGGMKKDLVQVGPWEGHEGKSIISAP